MTGFRERDVRNRMSFPPNVVADEPVWADRPEWTAAYLAGPPAVQPNVTHVGGLRNWSNPSLSWADLEWLRARWTARLVVKAIMRGDDARRAADCGVDGIVVSNHGGRQLDSVPGTLACLPEVVAAVPDHVEVLVDGGVRRGIDVVKALALGARAVLVGRLRASPSPWAGPTPSWRCSTSSGPTSTGRWRSSAARRSTTSTRTFLGLS